jgi:hypothetical protein
VRHHEQPWQGYLRLKRERPGRERRSPRRCCCHRIVCDFERRTRQARLRRRSHWDPGATGEDSDEVDAFDTDDGYAMLDASDEETVVLGVQFLMLRSFVSTPLPG